MPASSLFDQLRDQSRPSFEPEPLDTSRITKDVDTRLAKEASDYQKGQETAAKDAAKQQVQGLREKGYTVVHDEAGNPAPLTAANGEPVRRKAGSRIHVGEQTGTYYEPDLQKGGLKPAVGQKKTDKNGRIIEDFGGGLIKDLGEDPAWAKRKEDKTLLTKAEAAIRDKMLAPPPEGMDVVKTKKDYATAQKALAKAENNLESEPTDKDYLAAHAAAKEALDKLTPQNEAINQWSKSKTGLHRQLAQIKTHRELLGEGAFTDENRKQWQNVIAPPAAPAPAQVAPATPAPATVTPPAPTAGTSGQAALQASKEPMSESPTAAPTAPVAVQPQNIPPIAAPAPVVAAPQPNAVAAPVTPAPREQPVTPEAVADLPIDAHSSAIQASDAALKQNAAAIQQKQDAINAPVAAVDAKLSAWQAKSQAALAAGDAAISMRQLNGEMSPLFAASTKKELQDLYSERQEAEKKVASQLEELNGAWVAHQEDVDAHNQAVESLKGKITAQENERRSSIEKMREQPALAPYADKINALDKETAENNAKIDSASWDENAKEAARAGLKASHEAKLKDIQKGIEETVNPVVRLQKEQDFAEEYRQMKDTLDTGDVRGTDPKQVAKLKADLASKFNVSPDDFDKLANAAESRPYSVEDGKIKFAPANFDDAVTPDMTLKGFEQAVKDGVIDPKSAPEARAELQKANEEYQKLVAEAGGADKVKAALVGAGKGAAFMAGAELVGPVGAELGAKAGVLVGPEGVPIGATIGSIVGALLGGVTTGAAYDKIRETAGEYFKAVNSFNAAAKLNPGVTQASELASFVVMPEGLLKPSLFAKEGLKAGLTPAVAKSVEGYAKLADIAADAVGEAGASAAIDSARNVAKLKEVLKAGTGSVGGAVAFTAGQYAFDAGRYAIADLVGIKHDELHAPTFGDLATNVGLGLLLHGKGLTFKDYSTEEVKSILTRAKVRSDAGIGIDADVHPQFVIDAFKAAGTPLDTSLLGKDVGPGKKGSKELGSYNEAEQNVRNMLKPLSPEEKAVYESAKKKTEELESSGAFAGKGVEFGGARQASVPKMFGKAEPVTTATVRPKGIEGDSGPETPKLPSGLPPEVHTAASDAEISATVRPKGIEGDSGPETPKLPSGLPPEVHTAASDAEISANTNGGDAERASVLRDIATGAKVSTMTEGELNVIGLTHKGDKVAPLGGKDVVPAVQIDGKGNAIILQPAIDELRATFPATADMIGMDEKQAREKFAQNGKPDTRPTEPVVENAAPPTAEVAPEPRVEPTPSGEVAAKPVVPNPAALAKVADIAATSGKQSATKIQEKLSPLHPKVTKVIDGMISAYGKRGVKIIKEKSDATSGIEYDALTKVIILDLPKIQANTEGSTPNDTIAWVRDSVARHELVHLISTTDKAVEQHLDNLWSQLSDEDKSASAKTYYKGARSKWDSDFRGKHEFLVQLVQAAEDGKLEPALLKILKGNSKSLFNTLRQLMDALIARLQRILTDPKHKAHEAAKKTLEAFKAARARLFAEPVGKVNTTSRLTDKGETEGDLTTGLARKTTNPAEGGQSKSGIGNRPVASNEAPDASSFASGVASKVADSGDVATVDVKAHEAAASPHNDLTPPTPAQIEADNYKVGKVRLAGEDISIETPAGAKRREEWPALKDHYGRILGTKGADGELLDIFIKEGTPLDWNGPVFVVNQNKSDGTFDETKAIAGAKSVAEAREIYKRNYSKGRKGLGGIVKYDSLKDWVESDHSGKAVNKGVDVKPVNVKTGGMENQQPVSPPPLSEGLYKEKNEEARAYKIAQGFVWNGEEWVHPEYPGKTPFSSDVPAPKASDVRRELAKLRGEAAPAIIPPPPIPQPTAEVVQPPAPPKSYGSRYIENHGIDGAITRIDHLRKRLDEENARKNRDPRTGENLADEIDRIANAIIDVEPTYDWTTNTVAKPATALVAETLRASRDTLFDLPPRKRSLSGMRDAVSKRLDELERQEKEGNYPSDKSRGKKADDYEIRETGGMFVIHDKETGDDLGYTPYADRSKAEAKVKALNDAATLDNRTIVEGEDKLRERIDRLRTLLGKIEGAMAPAGTGGVISAATQYSQASEAILAENRAKAQAAMDKRLADRKADVAAAEADGWEVKRFEEKSSKRGGRPFTGWEVTHNGQRVKYGFSTKGEADERMVQLHKASVTRPKPTAEQNQATREELKAKGATSVVKAAEPEKAPELMTPEGMPESLMTPEQFKRAAYDNTTARVRRELESGNVHLAKAAKQKLKVSFEQWDERVGKFQVDDHKFYIERSLADHKPVSAPAVDAYKLTLPEGYVRDGDIYRYEPTNPTPATTPAEGQSTGGVVEGEKEGSEAAPTEPALMTPEQLAAYEKAKALQNATEALARAKSGEDKPNVFANGAKSKAELVRMRTADVNDAISGSFGDIWNTMLDAAREKKPIAVHLLDGLSKTRPETEPLHAQAERNLFEKGYVKEGALYVHKDSPVTTNPATPKETDKPPASSDVVNAPASTTPSPITNFDSFRAFVTRLQEGKITAEEVRSAWEQFKSAEKDIRVELQKMPKDRLLSMAGISARASDNKASLASSAFHNLENYFNPTDSLAYGMSGDMKAAHRNALEEKVKLWTDDIIRKQAEERRAAIAERDAAKVAAEAAKEKAINNPETAAEWDRHVYIKGFRSLTEADKKEILKLKKQRLIDAEVKRRGEALLTPEQLAAYDAVRGFDRKAEAQRQAEAKATVRGVTANTDSEIVETKHTQKGHDLFVVKLADRVERDVYNNLNIAAKRLGGYYSSFRGNGAIPGFQFPTREAAEQFQAVTKGETVDRSEAVQERQADRKNAAAERLNKTADRMDEQADAILNADRKTNTAKRAREAGYAESKANDAKAMAQTMRNLAAAIASGEAVHLDGVTTGTQVETLRSLAKVAKIQSERDEKLSYADREKRKYDPPTPAQMDAAHYPYPFVNRSDILKLVDLGRNTKGAKLLAERVNKIVLARDGGENGYITNPENLENFRELAKKVSERGKPLWDTYAWKFESYDRLQRMGLKDLPSLRAALREFTQFQNIKSRPDPLKEAERELVGMKLPGFFPTPAPVIDKIMEKADLQPGMSVLEPSAGKGDIADRAKAAGATVDTVEISSRLRDILKLKGYETLAHDIMDVKPESKQYDRILMNPPFENGQDIEHVQHAYSLLKPGGKLVAVMSEGPFYRNDKKATAFREWLDEHGDSEKLPEGAFAGNDAFRQTGTNTRLVTIEKPAEKLQSPNSDEYWSYNTVVKWMTDNGIPVDMTREEYEGEVARRKGIIEPPVHDTTQAGTAQMREQGGYEEYIKNEPRSFREKVWPEALQIVSKEPFKGTELVKELLDSPRALEDTERAILTHESLRRQKAYDKSIDDLIAAKPEDYAAAEKKMMAAREAHQEGLEALDTGGSKAGSALGAIRLMIKNDFSLGRLERRFRAALGPKPTPEEIKEADAKAAELAKVIKKNDELTEQIRSQLDEIAGLKAAMKAHEHGLTPKADRKAEIKEEDDALARLKSRRKLSSGDVLASPSPEDDDFNDLAIFGRRFIRDGASDLTSFTTAFNEAFPGALGDNASAVYEAAKVKFKEAEAAALKDSTPTGVTNKIKVKRAEITDLKADDLNRLALSIVQHETVKDVDTLRAKMHERLKEIFPHITERDVAKTWTGFEKAVYPSDDPFRKIVSDLRAQEQLILKVQTLLEEERLALKSGRQPPPRTDEQRKLIRKYNDLVKASGLTASDPATQLATAQTRATTALKHRRDDLQKQVDAEKRERRSDVTIPETPEMERLRGEIAALNKKLDILDPRNTGPTEAQKIKMAESGLKKSLDNVDKEIAELKKEIFSERHGRVFATKPESLKTSAWSTTIAERRRELEQRQKSRDELANQLDDLREAAKPVVDPVMKVLGKWEERQNLATVKAPPRTKSRLEELSKRYLDSESPRFVQDAVALGMSLGDAEDAKLILDAERNRREEIALASMRRRVRRNIERQVARAQAFDEDSPLARKTPAEKKLDKDLTEAEFQLSLAKREALRAEEKFRLRNRTPLRKAADFAVKWRRALILADYVVLYKLGMAAGWRMAFTPTEEAIGTAISKALPGLSKNAPREFGGSVRAEAEALTQGFRYLVENFGKVLKHGVSSMDTKYSSKPDFNDLDPSLSDYIGNSHAAIKLLPKASEFYRSFRKRTEAALRNGIDATSPAAVQAIGAAAYLDAQRAIFMNPNFVSEGWRSIIGKLRKTETSPNWAKATADVMEVAIPIVKVPTNILFEALGSYIGGILRETPFALKSAAKAATTFDGQGFAKRFNDEYSKLPPEQAEAVLRHLKKGAFGNALMLLVMLTGATASKLIGGLWTPDDKREPWQVKPERFRLSENGKDLHRAIAHNPVFDTLHFAVTAYQYAEKAANASKAIAAKAEVEIAEAEHRMKKSNADAKDFIKAKRERDVARKKLEVARSAGDPNKLAWAMATLSGMTTSTLALVEKAPLIGNVGQFLDAIPEDKKGDYLKKELAASVIPTGVTNIAKGEDEGPDGEPIKRKMESFSDHLKNRIPGLRQTLPFKNGETDEFGFKRSETHVPIPGEKAIENFNKKNPDVKYHIPKISQASLDDLPNEVAKTAFQIRAGELLRKYSKEGIVKSEVVNDGSREEPNFVTKKTVEISPITKEESENPTLKTIEKLKSMHRKAVTTAKSDAERPDWPLSYLDKYRSSVTK